MGHWSLCSRGCCFCPEAALHDCEVRRVLTATSDVGNIAQGPKAADHQVFIGGALAVRVTLGQEPHQLVLVPMCASQSSKLPPPPPCPASNKILQKNTVRTGVFVGHAVRYPINSVPKSGPSLIGSQENTVRMEVFVGQSIRWALLLKMFVTVDGFTS